MQLYQIKSHQDEDTLYEGSFANFTACLEQAVSERVDLAYANLKNRNLSNANLDDARLTYADFTNTNLAGANLSEAALHGAIFNGTALYNTCLSYSDLSACNFENAAFGATDIVGSTLSHSTFSTLSCFSLDFMMAGDMKNCVFTSPDGIIMTMSRPPVIISGLTNKPVIFMDRHIKTGPKIIENSEWKRVFRVLNKAISSGT